MLLANKLDVSYGQTTCDSGGLQPHIWTFTFYLIETSGGRGLVLSRKWPVVEMFNTFHVQTIPPHLYSSILGMPT